MSEITTALQPTPQSRKRGLLMTASPFFQCFISARTQVTVTPPQVEVTVNPHLSAEDQALKQRGYTQLQTLFQTQRFPRAIALVDGLAQRLPQDLEVRQWQAITYQRWGRYLIRYGHYEKARRALKKALRIDPHNRSLWQEVNRDFQRIEHLVWQKPSVPAPN